MVKGVAKVWVPTVFSADRDLPPPTGGLPQSSALIFEKASSMGEKSGE